MESLMRTLVVSAVFIVSSLRVVAAQRPVPARDSLADLPWPTGTFSILAYDPETGEIGGAVQSRVFSVGNGVLNAEAGVGAAATQAIVDVGYRPRAIALLRALPPTIDRRVRPMPTRRFHEPRRPHRAEARTTALASHERS